MAKYWMYPTCLFCFDLHLSSRAEQQNLLFPRSPLRNEGEYMAQIHATLQLQVGARSLHCHQQLLIAANFNCRLACTVYGRKQFEHAKIHLRHSRYFNKVVLLHCFPKVRHWWPIPLAARSKAWVCGHSLPGVVGSNPAGDMDVYCGSLFSGIGLRRADQSSRRVLQSVVCFECDCEDSIMRMPWPGRGCCAIEKKIVFSC